MIGSGALGLTSALQLQRMVARVTIYARERAAFTRSMRATGSWTPDSRIADADRVAADFPALWEQMARETYATHQTYLGTEGDPVVFSDRYMLSGAADLPRTVEPPPILTAPGIKPIRFAEYRLDGLAPRSIPLPVSASPFPVGETRMVSAMQFNVAELAHRLELGFALLADGKADAARAAFEAGLALPSRSKHDVPAKARAKVTGTAMVKLKDSRPRSRC